MKKWSKIIAVLFTLFLVINYLPNVWGASNSIFSFSPPLSPSLGGLGTTNGANAVYKNTNNIFNKVPSTTPFTNNACTGTITPDGVTSNVYVCAMTGNVTVANPAVMTPGTDLTFVFFQPSSGGPFTVSMAGSFYGYPVAFAPPVLTTTNNAADVLHYHIEFSTYAPCDQIQNFVSAPVAAAPLTVALDAAGTADVVNFGTNSTSFSNITVGTGTNRALLAVVSFDAPVLPSNLTAIWDSGGTNQSMTLITSQAAAPNGIFQAGASVAIFGLLAPTSGNKTLLISQTNNQEAFVDAISFTGVNQAGGTNSFAPATPTTGDNTDGSPSTIPTSITVPSAVGHFAVAAETCGTTCQTINGVNQNELYIDNNNANIGGSAHYAPGASSVNFTSTMNAGGVWVAVGVDVK